MLVKSGIIGLAVALFGLIAVPTVARVHSGDTSVASTNTAQWGANDEVTAVDQQTFDSVNGLHDQATSPDTLTAIDGTQNVDTHVAQSEESNVNDGENNETGEHQDGDNNGTNTDNNGQNGDNNGGNNGGNNGENNDNNGQNG